MQKCPAEDNKRPMDNCNGLSHRHTQKVDFYLLASRNNRGTSPEYCRMLNVREHLSWRFGYI